MSNEIVIVLIDNRVFIADDAVAIVTKTNTKLLFIEFCRSFMQIYISNTLNVEQVQYPPRN